MRLFEYPSSCGVHWNGAIKGLCIHLWSTYTGASCCCRSKRRMVHGPLGEVRRALPTAEKLLHLVLARMIGKRQTTEAWLKIGGQIRARGVRTSWTRIWPADWITALDSPAMAANNLQEHRPQQPCRMLDLHFSFLQDVCLLLLMLHLLLELYSVVQSVLAVAAVCVMIVVPHSIPLLSISGSSRLA
jgi:hypothetical protein